MAQTDRQTDKSSRWSMTVYEGQFTLLEKMPEVVKDWGWQDEICPTTGKLHKQGYLQTFRQVRLSAFKTILPGVHMEVARDWNKLLNYCKKSETKADNGERVHAVNANVPVAMGDALTMLAKYAWTSAEIDTRLHDHNLTSTPKEEYHNMVLRYLYDTDNVNILGMLGNNIMVNNWINYHTYFKKKLADSIIADASQEIISQEVVEETPTQLQAPQ